MFLASLRRLVITDDGVVGVLDPLSPPPPAVDSVTDDCLDNDLLVERSSRRVRDAGSEPESAVVVVASFCCESIESFAVEVEVRRLADDDDTEAEADE